MKTAGTCSTCSRCRLRTPRGAAILPRRAIRGTRGRILAMASSPGTAWQATPMPTDRKSLAIMRRAPYTLLTWIRIPMPERYASGCALGGPCRRTGARTRNCALTACVSTWRPGSVFLRARTRSSCCAGRTMVHIPGAASTGPVQARPDRALWRPSSLVWEAPLVLQVWTGHSSSPVRTRSRWLLSVRIWT